MVSSANSSYDDELKTNTCKSMSARKKVSTPSKTSYPYYILACVVMLCVGLGITYFFLQNNVASAQEYPVKGFDVSHHQGDIQWQSISPQEFKFVYLKATEGGDFKDRKFQDNWLKAREQGFLVGAYHFYRLCRDGQIQAQNFIETVPKKTDSLPPVIDLEYDSTCINTYTREQLLKEIQVMHDQLYKHYGLQPIFYTSKAFYNIVLVNEFKQTPLWIREYQGQPELKGNPKWIFWQHTSQGQIKGIPTLVDLNVFQGSEQDWISFLERQGLYQLPQNLPIK